MAARAGLLGLLGLLATGYMPQGAPLCLLEPSKKYAQSLKANKFNFEGFVRELLSIFSIVFLTPHIVDDLFFLVSLLRITG